MFLKKLRENLNVALEEVGLVKANLVQKKTIGQIKSGIDLICLADENTGRTTAIVVSVIQVLECAVADVPRAVIVVSDKEKGLEMKALFDSICEDMDLRINTVLGGEKPIELRDKIYVGTDVIIGTAKFLCELYSNSGINLNDLKLFVVDDANFVMKHEITSQLDRFADSIPRCQQVIFSSKMTDRIERYEEKYMNFPSRMDLSEQA